jgi:hypothetical protein
MVGSSIANPKILFVVLLLLALSLPAVSRAQASSTNTPRIYAQKLVEETLAAHPELATLEIAATPPGKNRCVTIASNEAKGIGERCDKDEFTAMKTNKPFVESEKENDKRVYDVTIPMHDASGKIIATAGLEFRPEPNQSDVQVSERSRQIAKEMESKVTTKGKLFETVR